MATRGNALSTDADVYLIDIAAGKADKLTSHQGQQLFQANDLSPDGRIALVSSNAQGGYFNVALLDISSRKIRWVTDTQWDAHGDSFSPDGKQFTYVINEDGRSRAFIADTETGKSKPLQMPEGLTSFAGRPTIFSLSHSESIAWKAFLDALNPTLHCSFLL